MVVRRVPVMIVNETVLFPNFEYRIETEDEKTESLINIVEQSSEKQVIMIHSLDGFSTDNVIEFPSLGVLSTLTLKLLVPNSKTRAVFQCHSRVSVTNYEFENGVWYVDIEDVETREIPKEKNTLYVDMLLRSYEKYSNLVSSTSNAMLHQLSFIESLADLTDSLAAILPFSIELKKKYLYEEDPIKRAISLLEQLKEEIALARIENEIDEKGDEITSFVNIINGMKMYIDDDTKLRDIHDGDMILYTVNTSTKAVMSAKKLYCKDADAAYTVTYGSHGRRGMKGVITGFSENVYSLKADSGETLEFRPKAPVIDMRKKKAVTTSADAIAVGDEIAVYFSEAVPLCTLIIK